MTGERRGRGALRVREVAADREWLLGAVRAHEQALESGDGVLKNEHKTAITRIVYGGRPAIVKQYRYMGARFFLKGLFRRHPARRSLLASEAMRAREVPTPAALGLVERVVAGLAHEAWFVTENLPGAVEMDRYVLRHFDRSCDRRRRAAFCTAFADAVQALMRSGIHHRDLKTCNVLVEEAGPGWRFSFIDLDDVVVRPGAFRPSRADWLLALAQLNPSTPKVLPWTDRLRFFGRLDDVKRWPRKPLIAGVQALSRQRRRAYHSDDGPVDIEFV